MAPSKTDLKDFSRPRQSGIIAIQVLDGDQLLAARLTDGNCEIMMAVRSGRPYDSMKIPYAQLAVAPLA